MKKSFSVFLSMSVADGEQLGEQVGVNLPLFVCPPSTRFCTTSSVHVVDVSSPRLWQVVPKLLSLQGVADVKVSPRFQIYSTHSSHRGWGFCCLKAFWPQFRVCLSNFYTRSTSEKAGSPWRTSPVCLLGHVLSPPLKKQTFCLNLSCCLEKPPVVVWIVLSCHMKSWQTLV